MDIVADPRALYESAVTGEIARTGQIAVSGKDRASYLQGLLTNDIQALAAGSGCYSAWLTPQGRMLTDMQVLESGDMILLDLPLAAVDATLQRLDQFLFSEDVQFADLRETLRPVWVHGSRAAGALERGLEGLSDLADWPAYRNARGSFHGSAVVVARIDLLGVPGYVTYAEPAVAEELASHLHRSGVAAATPETLEAARIEAGTPVFGVDMDTDTIPLEAGIEARAISFTKGCYVGQEVIIRVLHRGHGRVAKKLMPLTIDGAIAPAPRSKVFSGDREIGVVTSSAVSPGLGAIGLAYLHRDFLASGTEVQIDDGGQHRRAAVVVSAFRRTAGSG